MSWFGSCWFLMVCLLNWYLDGNSEWEKYSDDAMFYINSEWYVGFNTTIEPALREHSIMD